MRRRGRQDDLIRWWPEEKKLVFLGEAATPEFWDKRWKTADWQKRITRARRVTSLRSVLKEYLPENGSRILEGGCGDGHLVYAMNSWGYCAVGVDSASDTVENVQKAVPGLDVRLGDVRRLDFDDASFDGYLSGGVIEHFWEGYDDTVKEMHRVLKPGGYAFVTAPCVSRLDRVCIALSAYERFVAPGKPDNFYQFGLDIPSVKQSFELAGFQCVCIRRRNGLAGLRRALPRLSPYTEAIREMGRKNRMANVFSAGLTRVLAPVCGHGALYVMRKR